MHRKRLWLTIGVVLAALFSFAVYKYWTDPGRLTTAPEFSGLKRTLSENTLTSPDGPSVQMTFDERYRHLGGQKFVLYGTADVEQHFFVEEYPDGKLKSLFWIQFEAFLPDNDYTYDYSSSPGRMRIDEYDFYADAEPGKSHKLLPLGWPGTDGYAARKFVADKGYKIPDYYTYARLVHLTDNNRKELLIIFMDDLAPTGWTAESLREGGENHHRWTEVESAHLDKIKNVMKLSQLN